MLHAGKLDVMLHGEEGHQAVWVLAESSQAAAACGQLQIPPLDWL